VPEENSVASQWRKLQPGTNSISHYVSVQVWFIQGRSFEAVISLPEQRPLHHITTVHSLL